MPKILLPVVVPFRRPCPWVSAFGSYGADTVMGNVASNMPTQDVRAIIPRHDAGKGLDALQEQVNLQVGTLTRAPTADFGQQQSKFPQRDVPTKGRGPSPHGQASYTSK